MAGFGPPPMPSQASYAPPPPQSATGAIFQSGQGYAALHEGLGARTVGDIVTIVLVESIGTSKSTSSQTDRGGSMGITPPTSGPLSFLNPDALKAAAESSFKGSGNAAQRSTLNGAITVSIVEVRPNGTARVTGEKQMALSQGKEFVQFTGIVRLADIDGDNRVLSSQVADAQILYSGDGAIQRASKPGWLSAFFAKISPF
jgi:flagellar L-ring protein precursor FlgH